MTFLQPLLLWALPLMLVPVVIHLLNRMRYRSRRWAAMSFLLAASRQSQRQARLRHLLLLFCRALLIGALVVALARPLAGGWLGWALNAAPETVLILLDRSPSMETGAAPGAPTKRQVALDQISATARALGGQTRFVLIPTGSSQPAEVPSVDVLADWSLTAPTDIAADIPVLFETAAEYIAKTQPGRTEIWLASDLQESSWRPDSVRWESIVARLNALPQPPRVRLLALSETVTGNLAVSLAGLKMKRGAESSSPLALDLALDYRRSADAAVATPVSLTVNGARTQFGIDLAGPVARAHKLVPLGDTDGAGWGWVELPADTNERDNRAYFAFNPSVALRAVVVADDERLGRLLALAVAPLPGRANQSCARVAPTEFDTYDLADVALVVWAAPSAPVTGEAAAPAGTNPPPQLAEFAAAGGVVVTFPAPGDAGAEAAPADEPFRVTTWRRNEGPLADTADGTELPVADLGVRRRRPLRREGTVLAAFTDDAPFLVRSAVGAGATYACATLPAADWSDLGDGLVLVPMMQRLLLEGAERLSGADMIVCGQPSLVPPGAVWERVDTEASPATQPPAVAGVYRVGNRLFAVNRPVAEDDPATLDETRAVALFGSLPVSLFAQTDTNRRPLYGEIWRSFLWLMLLLLVAEAWLAMPAPKTRGWASDDTAPPAPRPEPASGVATHPEPQTTAEVGS